MPESQPNTAGAPERPWTLSEVSEFFRETPPTTRRRVSRGDLHPVRLPGGRRLLFDPNEVRRLAGSTSVVAS